MSYQGQRILAVVPARGGSKGIVRKNMRRVGGLSLVARAASLIREISWIDRGVISTDDPEIHREAIRFGLSNIGLRPADLSTDTANSMDVWRQAWNAAEEQYREDYELSILLEPTCPLRIVDDIERVVRSIAGDKFSSAVTVSENPEQFAPEKTLRILKGRYLDHYLNAEHALTRRQDVPQYFHRNGACYGVIKSRLFKGGEMFGEGCAPVVVSRPLINIDSMRDLRSARVLCRSIKN